MILTAAGAAAVLTVAADFVSSSSELDDSSESDSDSDDEDSSSSSSDSDSDDSDSAGGGGGVGSFLDFFDFFDFSSCKGDGGKEIDSDRRGRRRQNTDEPRYATRKARSDHEAIDPERRSLVHSEPGEG